MKYCRLSCTDLHGFTIDVPKNEEVRKDLIFYQSLKDRIRYKTIEINEIETMIKQSSSKIKEIEVTHLLL